MENIIYYFSGSGNSLWAAEKIAHTLGKCRLVRITKKTLNEKRSADADRFGIVFPVHAWGPPEMVEKFIGTFDVIQADYVFSLAVNAGSVENTQTIVNSLMKKQGREVDAFFDLRTPSNLGMRKPFVESSAINELKASELKLNEIITDIAARDIYPMRPVSVARRILKSGFAHAMVKRMSYGFDKDFKTTSACTSCGVCATICPSENIRLDEKGKVVWNHECTACMACISRCPQKAISFRKASPSNCYRNPLIKNSDYSAEK